MMQKFDVVIALEGLREAREKWGKARTEFFAGYDVVLRRLVHEGVRTFMSPNEIAHALGVSPKTIRATMRKIGLEPKRGKTVLSTTAAKALVGNAELLGINPHEMDLMSPLAYLPMGEQMKRELRDRDTATTAEDLPDVSGNPASRITAAIHLGIMAEENWDGPSVKPGTLTNEQIAWLGSWLAGEGIK